MNPRDDAIGPGVARTTLSAGRDLGRQGRQFRAVLGACRKGRSVPVRPLGQSRGSAHRAARIHRRGLALLSAGGASGAALRLSGLRPLRAGRRPPLQPEQAAARSVRAGAVRDSCAGTTCCSATGSAARARICRSTAATAPATCRNAASSRAPSPGATTAIRAPRGKRRSSTKCTCAASRSAIRRSRRATAAPSRRSPRRRSSTT